MTKLVGMECFQKSFGGNKLIRCELDNWMIAALAQSQSTRVSNLTMVTTGGSSKTLHLPSTSGTNNQYNLFGYVINTGSKIVIYSVITFYQNYSAFWQFNVLLVLVCCKSCVLCTRDSIFTLIGYNVITMLQTDMNLIQQANSLSPFMWGQFVM